MNNSLILLYVCVFSRYMSASPPPMLPPRGVKVYNSDSVPGSPQHLHTARINYTPEPQRRIFRQLE